MNNPLGTDGQYYKEFSARTPRDCCIKCYSTNHCSTFEFFDTTCILQEELNNGVASVVDPVDLTCPYGLTGILLDRGDGPLAGGPCARDYR